MRAVALTFPPGYELEPHRHEWPQLLYARRGVISVETEAGTWVVPPMRALWIAAGVLHALVMKGRVELRTLYVRPEHAPSLEPECQVVNVSPLLRELILSIVESDGLWGSSFDKARLELLVHLLAASTEGPLSLPLPVDGRAKAVAQGILDDSGAPQSLAALCRSAGASRRTVERLFRAETGMTLGRWRQQARLLESLRMLGDGHSVSSTALAVGYRSTSAFVFAFRELLGTTPAQYFRSGGPSPRRGQ